MLLQVVDGSTALKFSPGEVVPTPTASVRRIPVSAVAALGLVMVYVRVVVPPFGIVPAPYARKTVGWLGPVTVMVAVLLAAPGPLSVEESGAVALFCTPVAMPITVIPVMVQVSPAARFKWVV